MQKIIKKDIRYHLKASEKYIDVVFQYDNTPEYDTSVPIEYRRTGTQIEDQNIDTYLSQVYENVNPSGWKPWLKEQEAFWNTKPRAGKTKAFFDTLTKNFTWCCVSCTLPQNPNWARRIQDIKEFGYTLATNTNRFCKVCQQNTTQIIILPIKRGGITGYETWTPKLRMRIVRLLDSIDAFEAKKTRSEGLLPDHKFPEIRWDSDTKRECLEALSDLDILNDFQLLTNQRNQQKREVCRKCFQTGKRGIIYGISFFYKGTEHWDQSIPKSGKMAEKGCDGCGWYDINTWRSELNKRLNE
ncbi:MAG: hypothetical protein WAS93_08815 [Burkholderiaceae bacterium]